MANLYDGNGNAVSVGGTPTTADVKAALLAAIASGDVVVSSGVGVTLGVNSLGAMWEANAETAYNRLLTAYKQVPNTGIPFFICTDTHGNTVEPNRWVNNRDSDGMNIINFQMGDECPTVFAMASLDAILSHSKQIKNYAMAVGNHDKAPSTATGADVPNDYDTNRAFICTYPGAVKASSPLNCYSFVDGAHNAKVIVLDTNLLNEDATELTQGLFTDAAKWLIDELTDSDGRDVIVASHWNLFRTCKKRGDTEETSETQGGTSTVFPIWDLLVARKNKTSGNYTDSESVVHSFDFSDCKGELLCTLHGHTHDEVYSTVDGLTGFAGLGMVRNTGCTFGLIDRKAGKLKIWAFDAASAWDLLELPI